MKTDFRSFDFEDMLNRIENKEQDNNDLLSQQYFSLLAFGRKFQTFTPDHMIQLSLMSYGWMPTIIKHCDMTQLDQATSIINAHHHKNSMLNNTELDVLHSIVNYSYVGLSKFLHILMPDRYAIWDSRVARSLGCKTYNLARSKMKFLTYTDWIHHFYTNTDKAMMDRIRLFSEHHHGQNDISDLRAIEFCLYFNGDKTAI